MKVEIKTDFRFPNNVVLWTEREINGVVYGFTDWFNRVDNVVLTSFIESAENAFERERIRTCLREKEKE